MLFGHAHNCQGRSIVKYSDESEAASGGSLRCHAQAHMGSIPAGSPGQVPQVFFLHHFDGSLISKPSHDI